MFSTLLAAPIFTYGLTAAGGLLAYPVVHYMVTKVTSAASAVSSTVTSDIATLKADVASIKAKLPAV